MTREHLEKGLFVLSVAVLAFLLGFATRTFNWPPSAFLDRAWLQARAVAASGTPDFVAPRVYDRSGVRIAAPERVQPGLTLIATMWKEGDDWAPGLNLITAEGRVVHRWRVDPTELFPDTTHRRPTPLKQQDIHGAHLFPDGDVLINVEYAGTARLDACGRVRWKLAAGSHHSIARADDGTFWISALDHDPDAGASARGGRSPASGDSAAARGAAPYPGLRGSVHRDQLVHVSAEGEVLQTIDVLAMLYANGLGRRIFKADQEDSSDPTHLNDVEPLSASMAGGYPGFEAGDLLVSLRDLDLVLVVDPESGRVRWHATDPFIAQHDPDFMGGGWIGIFDNRVDGTERGSALGGSRVVAVEPSTDSTRVLFPGPGSEPFYTGLRGKWQQLPNGNLLLTEAEAGRIVEVAPDGSTVWEWVAEPYDESAVPWVSEGTRYDLTADEAAAWPCPPRAQSEDRKEVTDP